MSQLNKKEIVLITGGAQGVGLEIAKEFLQIGKIVCLWDISEKSLEQAKGTLNSQSLITQVVDLSDKEKVIKYSKELSSQYFVSTIVANAGIGGVNSCFNFDIEHAEKLMSVNYFGTLYSVIPFLKEMKNQKRGLIIGVCSLASLQGLPHSTSYSASKAAQLRFLESLQYEAKFYGIHVCIALPGFIKTAMANHQEFPLPFCISATAAAKKIVNSALRGKRKIFFPFLMVVTTYLGKILPWIMVYITFKSQNQLSAKKNAQKFGGT